MFSKKTKKIIPMGEKEKNEVMEFFTDPVYAYNSLYGIDQQAEEAPLTPEEQKK